VVIPTLNLEPGIEESLKRIVKATSVDEIIVVNDVTRLELLEEARKVAQRLKKLYGAKTFFRTKERGFGSAIRLGFEKARGDVIVVSMGDLCDDPETINKMVGKVGGGFDIVVGTRYAGSGGIIGYGSKQRVSRIVSLIVKAFSGVKCTDCTNAFRAYRRDVIKGVKTGGNFFDMSFELLVKAAVKGYKIGEVPTVWKNRDEGKSNFGMLQESKRYLKWCLYAILHKPSFIAKMACIIAVALLIIRFYFYS